MLLEHIQAAMVKAKYEILSDDNSDYSRIHGFKGIWANAKTLERCRRDLHAVLEGWILLAIQFNDRLPTVGGVRLKLPRVRV